MTEDAAAKAEAEAEAARWKAAFDRARDEVNRLRPIALRLTEPRAERAVFAEAESPGEAWAFRAEEHLCSDCLHSQVCEVAATLAKYETQQMGVMFRCATYVGATGLASELQGEPDKR